VNERGLKTNDGRTVQRWMPYGPGESNRSRQMSYNAVIVIGDSITSDAENLRDIQSDLSARAE